MVKQVIIVYRNANKFYLVEVQLTSLSTCEVNITSIKHIHFSVPINGPFFFFYWL